MSIRNFINRDSLDKKKGKQINRKMSKDKILSYLPYILLLIANFIYLLVNGLKPIGSQPKLILYNIIFFVIIGIVIIIKVNLLLHSWFIKQEGQVKSKTKKAIQKVKQMADFGLSIFKRGNERMMIKIFFYLSLSIMVNHYVPGILLGVFVGTYFQYKGVIEEMFKDQIKELDSLGKKALDEILQKVPKFKNSQPQNY